MFQRYDWVCFKNECDLMLTSTIGYRFDKGEKGLIIDEIIENDGSLKYKIKFEHRDNMIIIILDTEAEHYMELVD